MTVRIKEWVKDKTWWTWIEVTDNEVINLILRSLNNLIKVNANNEVYVDLQLEDWIENSDTLPIWVNVGRVLQADGRPVTWTLISGQTTSWDRVKVLYGDDWKIRVDNWTWARKILAYEYEAGEGIALNNVYNYSAMRGPCDEGFHVPSVQEVWKILDIAVLLGYYQVPWTRIKAPNNWYIKFQNAEISAYYALRTCTSAGNTPTWIDAYLFNYGDPDEQWHIQPLQPAAKSIWAWVRGFADIPVQADETWTVLKDGTRWAFYWNATLGLISVLNKNTNEWITLQDKNVWAVNVWDNWNYYQRWNNYGFTSAAAATSSTRVDASWYWPSEYSAAPINTNYDWSTVNNPNLWWGVSWPQYAWQSINNTWVLSVNGQTWHVTVSSGLKVAFIERTPNDWWYWELKMGDLGEDSVCLFYNGSNTGQSINGYIYDDQWVEILEISTVYPDLAGLPSKQIGTWILKNIENAWTFLPRQGFEEPK